MTKMVSFVTLLLCLIAHFFQSVFCADECKIAPADPQDRRTDKNKLRLIEYNAEFLFIDEFSGCPGSECPWANETIALQHMYAIADILDELDGDIINLCEVEDCDELTMLANNLSDHNYVPYLVKGTDTATGQDVALLTRVDPTSDLWRTSNTYPYPLPNSTCGDTADSGDKSVSKHYFTTLTFNGLNVSIISAHLLAFPTYPDRCVEREAQATVLRQQIEIYYNQGHEIIVIGDLNDYDAQILDAQSDVPTSRVLEIFKGLYDVSTNSYNNVDPVLTNVAQYMSQPNRFSAWWDSDDDCIPESDEFTLIDHILISDGLKRYVSDVFVASYLYNESCDTLYSDHYPYVVDFDFTPTDVNDDDNSGGIGLKLWGACGVIMLMVLINWLC